VKYIIYLVFTAFIVITILFLRNALQPSEDVLAITGSQKCGECHSLQVMGNQQQVWLNSKHAQAYRDLQTDKAASFTAKNNLVKPTDNKVCMKCHTTQNYIEDKPVWSVYKLDEGVGCEACHGAGSRYLPDEIMKDDRAFTRNGGLKGNENCLKCHSLTGNIEQKLSENVCPFQNDDFVYKTEFEKIKHPLNKENFQ